MREVVEKRWRIYVSRILAVCIIMQSILLNGAVPVYGAENSGSIAFSKVELRTKSGELIAASVKYDPSADIKIDSLNLTEPIFVRFFFDLTEPSVGDHYSFTLPEAIGIYDPLDFSITDDTYFHKFGRLKVGTDGQVDLTLLKAAETDAITGGWFEMETFWKLEDLEEETSKSLDFDLGGGTFPPIELNVKPSKIDADVLIEKEAQLLDSGEILWSIKVVPVTTPIPYPIQNVVVTDLISEDQTLVANSWNVFPTLPDEEPEKSSRAAFGLYQSDEMTDTATSSNGNRSSRTDIAAMSATASNSDSRDIRLPEFMEVIEDPADGFTVEDQKITYKFLKLSTPQTIEFKTVPNGKKMDGANFNDDKTEYTFHNTAGVRFPADASKPLENPKDKSVEASVPYPIEYVSKDGKLIDKDSLIQWSVKINPGHLDLGEQVIIQDVFQSEFLELTEGSVSYKPSGQGSIPLTICPDNDDLPDETVYGRELKLCPHNGAHYTLFEYQEKQSICYQVPDSDDMSGEFSYSTGFNENYEGEKEITNAISILGNGMWHNPNPTVIEPAKGWIVKKGIAYDPATHQITWEVRLNTNSQKLKDAVFEDVLSADSATTNAQKYVDGSFAWISAPGGLNVSGLIVEEDGVAKTQTLRYVLGDIEESITLQFKTELLNPEDYQTNTQKEYRNTASLSATYLNKSIVEESTASIKTVSSVLKKTGISYDYVEHIATWEIQINENQTYIEKAVLTDTLDNNLEWPAGDGAFLETNQWISWKEGKKPGKYNIVRNGNSVTISFQDTTESDISKESYTLVVKARIKDSVYSELFSENHGSVELKNEAELVGVNLPSVTVTGVQKVDSKIIGKEAVYEKGDDFVTFRILLNQHKQGIPLDPAVSLGTLRLEDQLAEGLSLDFTTVKLYEITGDIGVDGSYDIEEAYKNPVRISYGTVDENKAATGNICYNAQTRLFTFHLNPTIGSNTDSFQVNIDNDKNIMMDGKAYLLEFNADIDPSLSQGGTIKNEITLLGTSLEKVSSSSGETHAQYSVGKGGGTGRKGSIKIVKKDKYDPDIKMKDVTFSLENVDLRFAELGLEAVTATTDKDGQLWFPMLLYGSPYELSEITPAEYVDGKSEIKVLEGSGGVTLNGKQVTLNKSGLSSGLLFLEIQNTPKLGWIELRKKSSNTDADIDLNGATIKVYHSNGTEAYLLKDKGDGTKEKVKAEAVTTVRLVNGVSENGWVRFDGLRCGDYYMVETKAPDGYGKSDQKIYFTITTDGATELGTEAGAKGVYKDSTYQTVNSDPDAHILLNDPVGSVTILKKDYTDPDKVLSGATFALFDDLAKAKVATAITSDGVLKSGTSGSDGKLTFTGLNAGDYYIKEITPPPGYDYVLKNGAKEAIFKIGLKRVVTADGREVLELRSYETPADTNAKPDVITELVVNNMPRGSFKLEKTDYYDQSVKLKGAQIKVTLEGSGLAYPMLDAFPSDGITITTDETGNAVIEKLPYGSYQWEEIQFPDGYVKSDDVQIKGTFTVGKDHQQITVSLKNRPILGDYQFVKKDNEQNPLHGVVFQIYSDAAMEKQIGNVEGTKQFTSGGDGKVTITKLRRGTYYWKEITSPDGYEKGKTGTLVIADDAADQSVTTGPDVINWETGKHTIEKRDSISGELIRSDVTKIKVVAVDSKESTVPSTGDRAFEKTFDLPQGSITVDLKVGWYYYQETTAPDGYLLDGQKYYFEVKHKAQGTEASAVSVLKNRPYPKFDLEITKRGEPDDRLLQGAKIGIYKLDGKLEKSVITDGSGKALIENLLCADTDNYYYQEIEAPKGYALDDTKHYFHAADDGDDRKEIVKRAIKNSLVRGSFRFQKTDSSADATPVSGAEFELTYVGEGVDGAKDSLPASQKTIKAVSGQDGKVAFENLPLGTYICREIKAPDGFHLESGWSYEVELTRGNSDVKYLRENVEIPFVNFGLYQGNLEIIKTDDGGQPLAGAQIGVYLTSTQTEVARVVTGADGKAVFNGLLEADYYYKEIAAPKGYLLDTRHYEFSINQDGVTIQKTLVNKKLPKGSLRITKTGENNQPLSGAVIGLYRLEDDALLEKKTTGSVGVVIFDNLEKDEQQHYYYRELQAPEGYLLDENKHPVDFSIEREGQVVDSGIQNILKKGDFKLLKVKKGSTDPLSGAVITVYKADGILVGEKTTDSKGEVIFDGLVLGSYYWEETKAPAGYVKDKEKHEFTIVDHGQRVEVILENTKASSGGGGNPPKPNPSNPDPNAPGPGNPLTPPEPPLAPLPPGDNQEEIGKRPGDNGDTVIIVPNVPPNSEITIVDKDKNVVYQGRVDDSGEFTANLTPGSYSLVVLGEDGVPLAEMPFTIDDMEIPLAGLPKTGEKTGESALWKTLLLCSLLGSFHLWYRKRERKSGKSRH